MNAFDHLETELRAAVRREQRRTYRSWRGPAALGIAALLLVSGGALAASGTIRIGHVFDQDPNSKPSPHVGPGVLAGATDTLPLRVSDPAGGPPWALRVFRSSRGGYCVQVGQVSHGILGVVVAPGTLEPLPAWPGGSSSICSGQASHGLPVVRGLQQILVVGGASDARRCPANSREDCPVTSVTLLRYGLLGPDARNVQLVSPAGVVLASSRTNAKIGGAYLFAIAQPIQPYQAASDAQRAQSNAIEAELAAARARGVSDQKALGAAARKLAGRRSPTGYVAPPQLSIVARFSAGPTLRVAGRDRSAAALPGVETNSPPTPGTLRRDIPVTAEIANPGRFAVVTITFHAPLTITQFDRHYTATLRGPIGQRCTIQADGYEATTRNVTANTTVRFTLRKPAGATENGREGWCPGHFTGQIRYSTATANTTIGRYAFTIVARIVPPHRAAFWQLWGVEH